ncbi:MAG: PorT family protein [Bacteroidales bacterium]|nr:PorT family protein [Bacteroidales bacterium]
MNKAFLILILVLFSGSLFSQKYEIRGGISYGGPLPVEMKDSSSGAPGLGMHLSSFRVFELNEKWTIKTGIGITQKRVEYGQLFSKDTLVQLPDDEDILIPTYYKALVLGEMNLHYLDIFLLAKYKSGKWLNLSFGTYLSYLFAGYDKGTVEVIIGEGGFFDKYEEKFNNFHKIRKMDLGISLGSDFPLTKNLSLGFQINRSLLNLYTKNSAPDNSMEAPKLYHTYVNLFLGYWL